MTSMAENARRKRIAAALYDRGASFREIADLVGVSYQVARNYVQPDRYNARILVTQALADGHLTKADTCEDCGLPHNRLHAHHDNYSEPYKVRWLCPQCHAYAHPRQRRWFGAPTPRRQALPEAVPA